jgi:hypothetical protein
MNMNETDRFRQQVIDRQASKPGLRGKINAKCCECIYDPYQAGTWRKQVQECTSPACPLYPIRPVAEYSDVQ